MKATKQYYKPCSILDSYFVDKIYGIMSLISHWDPKPGKNTCSTTCWWKARRGGKRSNILANLSALGSPKHSLNSW